MKPVAFISSKLVLFAFMFALGCDSYSRTGDKGSFPLPGVDYSDVHTLPIVCKAVMPNIVGDFHASSSWVHVIEHDSAAGAIESEFTGDLFEFVPRSDVVTDDEGNFIHESSGTSTLIWRFYSTGGKPDWLRFQIDCSSGTERASYNATLLPSLSESPRTWRFEKLERLEKSSWLSYENDK